MRRPAGRDESFSLSASLDLRSARGLGLIGCCLVGASLVVPVVGFLLTAIGGGFGVAGLITHRRTGGERRWAIAAVLSATLLFAVTIAMGLWFAYSMEDFD